MALMGAKQTGPTKSELAILRVLWEKGPHSVREIQNILNETKPTGYTTVLKIDNHIRHRIARLSAEVLRKQMCGVN